jgi:hypothetical protein
MILGCPRDQPPLRTGNCWPCGWNCVTLAYYRSRDAASGTCSTGAEKRPRMGRHAKGNGAAEANLELVDKAIGALVSVAVEKGIAPEEIINVLIRKLSDVPATGDLVVKIYAITTAWEEFAGKLK